MLAFCVKLFIKKRQSQGVYLFPLGKPFNAPLPCLIRFRLSPGITFQPAVLLFGSSREVRGMRRGATQMKIEKMEGKVTFRPTRKSQLLLIVSVARYCRTVSEQILPPSAVEQIIWPLMERHRNTWRDIYFFLFTMSYFTGQMKEKQCHAVPWICHGLGFSTASQIRIPQRSCRIKLGYFPLPADFFLPRALLKQTQAKGAEPKSISSAPNTAAAKGIKPFLFLFLSRF